MAHYLLTDEAENDLNYIAEYSYLNFGPKQAEDYRAPLKECFEMLAMHPHVGTVVGEVLKGAWRHPHEKHVIYYEAKNPLLVLRVLGERQDPLTQLVSTNT